MKHRRIDLTGDLSALYVEVDEKPTRVSWAGINVIREDLIKPVHETYGSYVEATFVHVISRPAGGEVRGYAIVHGAAHLRLPARPHHWPEVDLAVGEALGLPLYGAGGYPMTEPAERVVDIALGLRKDPDSDAASLQLQVIKERKGKPWGPEDDEHLDQLSFEEASAEYWADMEAQHLEDEAELDAMEEEAERMHGDHQSALESVYGPND